MKIMDKFIFLASEKLALKNFGLLLMLYKKNELIFFLGYFYSLSNEDASGFLTFDKHSMAF